MVDRSKMVHNEVDYASLLSLVASPSPPDASSLDAALALVSQYQSTHSVTPSTSSYTSFDADPFSSLLSPTPRASTSTAPPPPSPLEWLHASLAPHQADQVLEILKSPSSDTDIAESLLEIWGFEGIESVGEAVTRRAEIVQAAAALHASAGVPLPTVPEDRGEPTYNSHDARHVQHETKRDYTPGAQLVFRTPEEVAAAKKARKAARHHKGKDRADDDELDLEEWDRIRQESLAHGPGALISGKRARVEEAEQYPNVYLSSSNAPSGITGIYGQATLPIGTTREDKGEYEEIMIPAPKAVPFRFNEAPVPISSMDEWGRRTFHAYKSLNRLQSVVFPVAYKTNENMLVCAPTGAGKTDVALLTILRCLSSLAAAPLTRNSQPQLPPASAYKIVYVAPLKALAAEITLKFAKRLSWAGVKCRELTGDMKLTRKEVDETGIIVTTPEKWDVVTRKGSGASDGDVADKVKLLIIDEVHLLHEDRGSVIESIVARTLRQVESSQSLIRIVGLSATLPNYIDVADFLHVNRYVGLFFFDSSFRPVPLEQHFLGVRGKPGSIASRNGLDNAAFDKVAELVKAGHQVMVFVHARKETVKTAEMLREKAAAEGILDLLDPKENEKWGTFKRDMGSSRNREMKELAETGFGIHHAGMLRSDRNITERMFEANVTKVLCCTATLAWGVNLPAYAVVIKGTQLYDSGKGAFVDLSILDVLQIFGRAGRPQYEDQGVGYICTTSDKLDHYVQAIAQQHPIESKFEVGLVDGLNAEISLGTVSNADEGLRWLGYSYLFVRMRKNPLVYGMTAAEVAQDPLLGSKRTALINNSAKRLVECQMIKYDPDLGTLESTDLGRIASRYYIRNASIEIFNKGLRPQMGEADVLALIASSVEFGQINVRENEIPELQKLIEESCPCQVNGGTQSSAGKVNVLLQAYISKAYIEDFALVSDSGYVSQNAARIVRALLDIAMARRWAPVTLVLMSMSKAIEKRLWSFGHPLAQFSLSPDLIYNIERWADDLDAPDIAAMSDADFGALIHQNERLGAIATAAARQVPLLSVTHTLQPIGHDLLRVRLELTPQFQWSEKQHGSMEAFWVWIEDEDNLAILQVARLLVRPATKVIQQDFIVSIASVPKALYVRAVSDRWYGSEHATPIDLEQLIMPPEPPPHLPLLDLPLLRTRETFSDHGVLDGYPPAFDPVQTQAFHTLYHTSSNALVCAPSASSRGILLELAIWRAFAGRSNARVVFLTPRKSLAHLVAHRLRRVFATALGITPVILSRLQDLDRLKASQPLLAVASPSLLRYLLASSTGLGPLDLIIAHDVQALDAPYELLLSRLRWSNPTARIVGSSSSLQDPTDLATWLGVPPTAAYSFPPSIRTSALTSTFQSFATPHSMSLLRSMIRPAYAAMRGASGTTLCFVPSRAQCRTTARDLVTQTAAELDESFIPAASFDMVQTYAESMKDAELGEALSHGIAIFHEGLRPEEQRLALELFAAGAVPILIASREACWTLSISASLVIVMSAQFAAIREDGEREIQDYPLPELLQMQSLAVPPRPDASAEFLVLCQKEQAELYQRFLLHGIPLESELASDPLLISTIFSELVSSRISQRQDVVDFLSWTFLSRRVVSNSAYYGLPSSKDTNDAVSRLADRLLDELERRCAAVFSGKTGVECTKVARLFGQRSVPLRAIEALQLIPLDRLVMLSKPAMEATPASAEGEDGTKTNGVSEGQVDHLANFRQRLPRAIKDDIGAEDDATSPDTRRRILLGAFRGGRLPRGEGAPTLEKELVGLLRRILSQTSSKT
ncbi:DNA/RNA helicase, DEAD/DEAH box type [Pseudohyphozyma bogoriensis]|nr:DNA/RNA helicase, DEAD/DEAH box type [Pseudohyphozyma bogoriensis]